MPLTAYVEQAWTGLKETAPAALWDLTVDSKDAINPFLLDVRDPTNDEREMLHSDEILAQSMRY